MSAPPRPYATRLGNTKPLKWSPPSSGPDRKGLPSHTSIVDTSSSSDPRTATGTTPRPSMLKQLGSLPGLTSITGSKSARSLNPVAPPEMEAHCTAVLPFPWSTMTKLLADTLCPKSVLKPSVPKASWSSGADVLMKVKLAWGSPKRLDVKTVIALSLERNAEPNRNHRHHFHVPGGRLDPGGRR